MVTTDKDFQSYKDNDKPCTFYGLSTDDKPTTMTVNERVFDVVGGSVFVEIDTGGIYMYDEENQEWYQMNSGSGGGGGGGGSSTLVGLTDVDISNPTDGQTLVYNAESQKWVNGESAGGGSNVVVCHIDYASGALDKTYREIVNGDTAVFKFSQDGTNIVMYLAFFDDIQTAVNSGTKKSISWIGHLVFVDIQGAVVGSSLPNFVFVVYDPDDYPVAQ